MTPLLVEVAFFISPLGGTCPLNFHREGAPGYKPANNSPKATRTGPKLVGHLSRDATAIAAPERPAPEPRPRGRPAKGAVRPPPLPKRLDAQLTRPLAAHPADSAAPNFPGGYHEIRAASPIRISFRWVLQKALQFGQITE